MPKESERLKISSKPPKGEDGYRTFSIRIKEELVFDIEQLSRRTGRSRNELIGILLQYAVGRCDVEEL
ncbi:MAG: ribbon-helix-helix domain-containing protein [Lachnospiraceae bacterium]|nr:ribbon-helix-helix domain-containing protein [Lachnospiraceae bacterium]